MNHALCRLVAALSLLTAGCSSLPLISKPLDTETSISMGKGKVTEPTTSAPGAQTSAPAASKPSASGGAPSAAKPSSASTQEPTGAETALKIVASPSSLHVIPVMPTGEITGMLYRPEEGTAHWEIEATRGTGPIKLGKVVLSFQSTAQYAPPAPTPDPAASSGLNMGPATNTLREKGTPVTFELAAEDVGLSKSIAPGEKRSVELDLKHSRMATFLKANPKMREFEAALSLFDEAGNSVKASQGGELKLIATVRVE